MLSKLLNIILKSNHNNNIRFMKIIISIAALQFILLIYRLLNEYGEPSFFTELDIRMWIILSLTFSTIITLISFPRNPSLTDGSLF